MCGDKKKRLNQIYQIVDKGSRLIIGVIFIVASVPKLLDVSEFGEIIGAYGILPDFLIMPVAICLASLELILGIGLIMNSTISKVGVLLLLLLFIFVLSYALLLGLDIDCGCFMESDPEHQAFQGLRESLVRDGIMVFGVVFSLWYGLTHNVFTKKEKGESLL